MLNKFLALLFNAFENITKQSTKSFSLAVPRKLEISGNAARCSVKL